MRILVVGGSGMLGTDFVVEVQARGHELSAPARGALDITDPSSIAAFDLTGLGWCVNCAAYTAVDRAETDVREATELNALAPSYLARACAMSGVRLAHVSTDFVFDGTASAPYLEDSPTRPLGIYGRTKREGEEAVLGGHPNSLVVRTSWLYGPNGRSFPRTMIEAWLAGKPLRVVADQVGCPTYTADLARMLVDLIEREPHPGVYHAAGPEAMSWHEFAVRAIEAYREATGGHQPVEIEPIRSEDWPTPAPRPRYSVLSFEKVAALGIAPMRPVDEALRDFMRRIGAPHDK